jgi:hypothetical protein
MPWFLSEEFISFGTPGFDTCVSLNTSPHKPLFVFTAKVAYIVSTRNRDFSSDQM